MSGLSGGTLEARRLMARKANRDYTADDWQHVANPAVGHWFDWADVATDQVGQCCMGVNGWEQAPLGTAPVVLAFRPRHHSAA